MDMVGSRLFIRVTILILCLVLGWKLWEYSCLPSQPQGLEEEKLQEFEMKKPERMKVEVYYETLCPDSKHFIIKQLKPAYEKLHSIMDITFVPYGKAKREELSWGTKHVCQHGPVECLGNTVHACVVDAITDQKKQLDIVSCMIERNEKPMEIGEKCVLKFGESWDKVKECTSSPKAAVMLQTMGVRTENLNPKVSFIPTIQINGDLSEQSHILQNLHKIVCQRYRGQKPPSC